MGVDLDLDHVPQRETGMTPYEIMLSESQERMLMVLKQGREDEARQNIREVGARPRDRRALDRFRPHGGPHERRRGRRPTDRPPG